MRNKFVVRFFIFFWGGIMKFQNKNKEKKDFQIVMRGYEFFVEKNHKLFPCKSNVKLDIFKFRDEDKILWRSIKNR